MQKFIFLSVLLLLLGCKQNNVNPFEILDVKEVTVLDALDKRELDYCKTWQLSKKEVAQFFALTEEYDYSPYSLFEQMPCNIEGTLLDKGQIWHFSINGGAMVYLQNNKNEERYFGCKAKGCEKFVLLPYSKQDD